MTSLKVRCQRKKDKNGYFKYSTCVLVKGLPFYVYVSYSGQAFEEEYLHVESPVAIEHLGLPYEVFVYLRLDVLSPWIAANIYRNGVVETYPIRLHKDYFNEKNVEVTVTFHS